jgi:hypothetical protein
LPQYREKKSGKNVRLKDDPEVDVGDGKENGNGYEGPRSGQHGRKLRNGSRPNKVSQREDFC